MFQKRIAPLLSLRSINVLGLLLQTGQLHHTFSGHFEEVTGLVLVGSTVVSVGIDATIRQWSLKPDELQGAIDKATKPPSDEEEQTANPGSMLTEEEERELAELMEE